MLIKLNHSNSTKSQPKAHTKYSLSSSPSHIPLNTASRGKSQCPRHNYIHQLTEVESTFEPQIRDIPFQLYPNQWQNLLKSKKDHWQELTRDNRQRNYSRMEQKIWEQNQLMKKCTFEPTTTSKHRDSQHQQQVFTRLFQQAQIRKNDQIQKQKQWQQEQKTKIEQSQIIGKKLSNFTFMNKQKFDLTPLYLRLQKVVQQQMQHRKMVAQKEEVQCTFKPNINKQSEKIMSKKQRIDNIVDRLLQDFKLRESKVSQLKQKINSEINANLTFRPNLTSFMPAQPPSKCSIIQQLQQEQQKYKYRPQINQKSLLITKEERQDETQQDMINRHHSNPIPRLNQKLSFIESQMYAQCSFNPEINQISREMIGQSIKTHACKTPAKQNHSYRPKINQSSKTMTATKRARSVDSFKQKTKVKAQNYLKLTEYDQLKQCTFQPKIINREQSRTYSKMTSLDQISGFKHFKRNSEKAQEQQKSRKILEQKLFNLEKSYDQRMLKKSRSKYTCDNSQNIMS